MILPPKFAAWLRDCRRLRIINYIYRSDMASGFGLFDHLDRVESAGDVSAHIFSVRYGYSELLYGRMLVMDVLHRKGHRTEKTRVTRILYTANLASLLKFRPVLQIGEPFWYPFSEYEGMAVPMEVITAMKKAEGVKEDDYWDRRGVEFGAEAWRVLMSWKSKMVAGECLDHIMIFLGNR